MLSLVHADLQPAATAHPTTVNLWAIIVGSPTLPPLVVDL
jgi:hypothetical protein